MVTNSQFPNSSSIYGARQLLFCLRSTREGGPCLCNLEDKSYFLKAEHSRTPEAAAGAKGAVGTGIAGVRGFMFSAGSSFSLAESCHSNASLMCIESVGVPVIHYCY